MDLRKAFPVNPIFCFSKATRCISLNLIYTSVRIFVISRILRFFHINFFNKTVSVSLSARFSHEFRTHLTGIIGYSEYLESIENNGISKFTAKIINEGGLSLLKTGNAYFELNNFLSGGVGFNFSKFLLSDLIDGAVRKHKMLALERHIDLGYSCSEELLGKRVTIDGVRMSQILDLLIFETLQILDKFSILKVILKSHVSDEYVLLNFEFADVDVNSHQLLLFENFWNDPNYVFKLQEGPGVVLAMVREVLFLMGADFELKLDRDGGSGVLTIAIPAI